MPREKDVSTRLLRPTLPVIDIDQLVDVVNHWDTNWETDASVHIFDEGIAQYMLTDMESHLKFYAALIHGKPSLRCTIVNEEPEDVLDMEAGNKIDMCAHSSLQPEDVKRIEYLKQILSKRGYHF